MKTILVPIMFLSVILVGGRVEVGAMVWSEAIQTVLGNTQPLKVVGKRTLPLYLWPAMDPGLLSDASAEQVVGLFKERGIGLVASWDPTNREASLEKAFPLARAQKKLGVRVNINANACLYSFHDGSTETAHLDEKGEPFFDTSFGVPHIGCPFRIDHRREVIRERVEFFVNAYKEANLPIGFVFADWEIDGPMEWNGAWESSKRCRVCRENIPDLEDFESYQAVLRSLRSDLLRDTYSEVIHKAFPEALVSNYAVNPHDGFRYWYDYFEKEKEEYPAKTDQKAVYRKWFKDEFALSGFNLAMPVIYTWYRMYKWYEFDNPDYHWFYPMLLEGSSVGKSTPAEIPILSFVHWSTTDPPKDPDPRVRQLSKWAYQELLWHLLMRGHDSFFLWCPANEYAQEVSALFPVWAESYEYEDFLMEGQPLLFEVPKQPGPVLSAVRLGNRVLVRRTDFTDDQNPVKVQIEGKDLDVERRAGCQILSLE